MCSRYPDDKTGGFIFDHLEQTHKSRCVSLKVQPKKPHHSCSFKHTLRLHDVTVNQ